MESDNYIVIQGWMCNELNLKGNDLLVFALIYGFSQDGESVFAGSRKYIADTFNISLPTVDKALNNLLDCGYIEKTQTITNGVIFNSYKTLQGVKKLYRGSKETLHNNTNNISNNTNNNYINNKQNILLEDNEDAYYNIREKSNKVDWFVDNYNSICKSLPKCTKVTAKRRKDILKILKNYSEEEIIEVFNNLENSDFCKGKSNSGWKANIDFILREDKFVATLEGRYNNKSYGCNVESISNKGAQRKRVSKEEKEEMRRLVELGELEEY